MGKIKIHEIAKELGLSSKEVLEKAKKLGIEVTSHLSNIDDEQANMIKSSIVSYNHALYCIKYEKDNNSSDIYETADKLKETLGMEK